MTYVSRPKTLPWTLVGRSEFLRQNELLGELNDEDEAFLLALDWAFIFRQGVKKTQQSPETDFSMKRMNHLDPGKSKRCLNDWAVGPVALQSSPLRLARSSWSPLPSRSMRATTATWGEDAVPGRFCQFRFHQFDIET